MCVVVPNKPRMQPTEEQMQKILSMREQGVPKKRIGAEIGVCELIVTRWLDEYDGVVQPRHCPKYGKNEARKHSGIYFDVSKIELNGGESNGNKTDC